MAKITVEYLRKIFTQLCIGDISEENAVDLLNEKASEPEWISVKDRLPENDQRVLAIGSGTHPVPCKFNGEFYRDVDLFADDKIIRAYYASITLWMPLPNKPVQLCWQY